MTDPIIATTDGPIKILSINDAPINRMSLEFMDALEDEVSSIADDPRIRAVVLTAEGDSNFSVGMDLKQLPEGLSEWEAPRPCSNNGYA